jgi:hypothetical protein
MPHSTYTGPPATIVDMRRIGVSAFIIECAALYCYHQARVEFDALALPDEPRERYPHIAKRDLH